MSATLLFFQTISIFKHFVVGLAFVNTILSKHPSSFVYAGARDPENAPVLQALTSKYLGRISVLKLVSSDVDGNSRAAKVIEECHGRVDTVIANAGIGLTTGLVVDVSPEILDEHFHVHIPIAMFVVDPITLY